MIELLQGNCLEQMDNLIKRNVKFDAIITDPPYGTMNGFNGIDWDYTISPEDIFNRANSLLRKNGKLILFSQEPYSSKLINSTIPNIPFSYRMIWEKDNFANALLCNKAPVGFFEEILIFSKYYTLDRNHKEENPAFLYLKKEKEKSKISTNEFNIKYSTYKNKINNPHRSILARSWETSQFLLPNKEIYEKVLQSTGFFSLEYETLKKYDVDFRKSEQSTFNLWEGNKFKSNILKHKKDYGGFHPTQKPISLMEDVIKTFTNENDHVLDFTMGSGSTGVACVNTNRNFIGIELDENYFKIAKKRIIKNYEPTLF